MQQQKQGTNRSPKKYPDHQYDFGDFLCSDALQQQGAVIGIRDESQGDGQWSYQLTSSTQWIPEASLQVACHDCEARQANPHC